jgi:hypothetical protein
LVSRNHPSPRLRSATATLHAPFWTVATSLSISLSLSRAVGAPPAPRYEPRLAPDPKDRAPGAAGRRRHRDLPLPTTTCGCPSPARGPAGKQPGGPDVGKRRSGREDLFFGRGTLFRSTVPEPDSLRPPGVSKSFRKRESPGATKEEPLRATLAAGTVTVACNLSPRGRQRDGDCACSGRADDQECP